MPKYNVVAGGVIQFSFGDGSKFNPTFSASAQVLAVKQRTLTVAESMSANGLAEIVIHSTSFETGAFWYSYQGRNGLQQQRDITNLTDGEGAKISCEEFIEN